MLGITWRSDPGYLVEHAREKGAPELAGQVPVSSTDYYVEPSSRDEPPGLWWGRGAEALGLVGEVDQGDMKRLFGDLEHPRTGEALGSRPRTYAGFEERFAKLRAGEPDATPERLRALEVEAHKSGRQARNYADFTFSPPKSWSVLHASYDAAGDHAKAEALWEAWTDGVKAGLGYAMDEAGYSRAGYHGRQVAGRSSGRWVEGHDFVVSLWRHHTSRDGDPQLHVHAAVLNRVRNSDGVWRSLDSKALTALRPAAAAIAERVAEESARRRLGVDFVNRPDGKGREIDGVSPKVMELFSSRRRTISAEVAKLAEAYEARYARAPSAYQLRLMAEHATLSSRRRKDQHPPTRAEYLEAWEARVQERQGTALAGVYQAVEARVRGKAPVFDPEAVIAQAVEELDKTRSVWDRSDLISSLNRALPSCFDGLEARQVVALLDDLADGAITGSGLIANLTPPAIVEAPAELRRADGRSVYEPHRGQSYATIAQLQREEGVLSAARSTGATRLRSIDAEALVGRSALSSDQARAVSGILSSGRRVEVLVGPPGTGKSFTVGTLSSMWSKATGGKVVGLAASQRAVNVLTDEGVASGTNISAFLLHHEMLELGRHSPTFEASRLGSRDLVILDEASMVTTSDFSRIVEITQASGAKLLVTGDPEQLSAVGGGGMMAQLVKDFPHHSLGEVRRFSAVWEAQASLGLRSGDPEAIYDYERHGRLRGGTEDEMISAATTGYLTDHLNGARALLIASTNDEAAHASSIIRSELVGLGRVDDGLTASLRDHNRAGAGDLIEVRKNDWKAADGPVINRELYRVVKVNRDGGLIVEALLARDAQGVERWGRARGLKADYVSQHVNLGYATTIHAAQGATVDAAHAIIRESSDRADALVALTRAKHHNLAYVISEDEVGDDHLGILGRVFERAGSERSATEVLRDEYEAAESLGRLGPIWTDLRQHAAEGRYERYYRIGLGDEGAAALEASEATAQLNHLVRQAEDLGYDAAELIADAVAQRELGSADDVARVLHHRISRRLEADAEAGVQPARSARAATYLERTHAGPDETGRYAVAIAKAMDDRVQVLGQRAAGEVPQWTAPLGPMPEDPVGRQDWIIKAGAVAAYREHFGKGTDVDPIGSPPGRSQVDALEAWHLAADALDIDPAQRGVRGLSDIELGRRMAEGERARLWEPRQVDVELRDAHLEARHYEDLAARQRATFEAEVKAMDSTRADEAVLEVRDAEALAAQMRSEVAWWEMKAGERQRWEDAEGQTVASAREAESETERRRAIAEARFGPQIDQAEAESAVDVQADEPEMPRETTTAEQADDKPVVAETTPREPEALRLPFPEQVEDQAAPVPEPEATAPEPEATEEEAWAEMQAQAEASLDAIRSRQDEVDRQDDAGRAEAAAEAARRAAEAERARAIDHDR